MKSGRSAAGAKAAGSHTGALVSASDVTVDALFRQAGVIRTDTLSELLDVAKLLASQPAPTGARVGIVTNAGGLGILCADACEAAGLEVPQLPEGLRDELASFLAPAAATGNPVDMIATASAADYRRATSAIAAAGAVDAIVALFIPPLVTPPDAVADALVDAAAALGGRLPLVAVFAAHDLPARLAEASEKLPVYTYPEEAAAALAKAVEYGRWRLRPVAPPHAFDDTRRDEAAATIAAALERGAGWLRTDEVGRLLSCYGVPLIPSRIAETPEEVGRAGRALGGKVAVKAIASGLVHKSDVGAVELGVSSRGAVSAARRIESAVTEAGHRLEGYVVQRMAEPGVEVLIGSVHDPVFGPVVVCGGGGTTAEVIADVAVRLAPLAARDAREMIRDLRTYPLLDGYRGAPRAHVGALEEVVLRLSALVDNHAEVSEVDLNPVIVGPAGATVVDARVRVEASPPRRPWPALDV